MPSDSRFPDAGERLASLHSTLEPLAKGTVAAVAICYALGLLIKNIYLATWSTSVGNLLDSEYVLCGALFVFLFLLATTFWNLTTEYRRSLR
jgi:hypothetical protein